MKEGKSASQTVYAIWCVILVSLAATFFLAWQNHHYYTHPSVVAAQSALYIDEYPVEGWLLWQEEVISAPLDGALKFVNGGKVARVAKGEAIAVVQGKDRRVIWAPKAGYFVPALDGQEGKWSFGRLWLDYDDLPKEVRANPVPQGVDVKRGSPIGKIIPLPQALRCVFYTYLTPKIKENLERNFLWIRFDERDIPLKVEVLAKEIIGLKARVNISLMPYFPAHLTVDRKLRFMIYEGRRQGVLVPEESVIFKDGKQGVYVVSKGMVVLREISGVPTEDKMYFVDDGLLPGEIVVLKGDKAREGRVFLW